MKNIIIPTGYMMSGSSAVTDLLSEIEGISNIGGTQEYIFLHCPNGVFELEKKLLEPTSCLSSKNALIEFRKMMEKLYYLPGWWPSYYKETVSTEFLKFVDEYIFDLTDLTFKGFYYMDEFPRPRTIKNRIINYYNRVFLKHNRIDDVEMILSYPTKEQFYDASKKFIKKFINAINKEKLDSVVIDQLLVPQNIYKLDNYFDKNAKVIIVERDPRDIFISNKYFSKECNGSVPYPKDVKQFCNMYKKIRENEIIVDNKNVLRIKFEDLIYNYEITLDKIYKFLKINSKAHIYKKSKFNPDKSIENTQLFTNEVYNLEVKIIERELRKYLYNFPYIYEKKERNNF